jgi:hypothetical protein
MVVKQFGLCCKNTKITQERIWLRNGGGSTLMRFHIKTGQALYGIGPYVRASHGRIYPLLADLEKNALFSSLFTNLTFND